MKQYLRNKYFICSLILTGYVLMLNVLTPYVADDFVYKYSFRDGTRITSVLQIFPSLYQHYMDNIGRIVPHFFAQLFLMGPKWIFNIANTLMFVLLVALIVRLAGAGKKFSAILYFLVPILIWQFVPGFGQVFLWEDGSFNYLWSYTFAVVYLIPYVRLLLGQKEGWFTAEADEKTGWKIALCIYTFFFGNYSESVSFSVIFISFLMLLLVSIMKKQWKCYLFYVLPVICGALGYLMILISPGEATHMDSKSVGDVIGSLIRIMESFYTSQKTLLVLWAVLMVAAVYCKADRRRIALAVFLFLISLCSVALLAFGTYLEDRAMAAGSVFLIFSVVTLLQALRPNGEERVGVFPAECVVLCIGMYFIAGSLLNLWNGSYDIYETNRRNSAREAYIIELANAGVTELTVPQIEAATIYCAKYGLADIYAADKDGDWLNKAIAKYYGLENIYGE
jgi:hypothetical protein